MNEWVVIGITAACCALHWRVLFPRLAEADPERSWTVLGWFLAVVLNFAIVASMFFAAIKG